MNRLLFPFVFLFTLLFSYCVIAQEFGSLRKGYQITFPERIQNPLGPPLPAGTYTVGTGGYFPTIDSAFNKLHIDGIAGAVNLKLIDTFYQASPGHRFELVGPIIGAGPNSRITIRPNVNTKVKVEGDSTAVLTFTDVKYITLDGHSDPSSSSAEILVHARYNIASGWNDCIDVWRDADYNQFLNLTLKSDDIRSLGTCLAIIGDGANKPDSNLVEGNYASGTIGITVYGATIYRPRGNIIRGNIVGSDSETLGAWGIISEYASETVIEGNTVQNLLRAFFPDITLGIQSFASTNTIIRNNVVRSLFGSSGARVYGITGYGNSTWIEQGLQIYNNMIYDLQNTSVTGNGYIGGISLWQNNNVLIAYNTVHLNGTGNNPGGTDVLGIDMGVTNAIIRNNILVNTYRQMTGWGSTALWLDSALTFTSDNNDLYVDSTFTNSWTVAHNKLGSYRNLSSWQATGNDTNSITVMPNFIASDNLHINKSIPTLLESHATPIIGITTDIDGNIRHTTAPDIGADEFDGITGAVGKEMKLPKEFMLSQNYPNPWNPTTNIKYSIPKTSLVSIKVYDILGNEIKTLVNEEKSAGNYELSFNAANLPSGVYFYRLQAGSFVETKKMMLLK